MNYKQMCEMEKDFKDNTPFWKKKYLLPKEAAEYFGIGIKKIYDLTNKKDCDFLIYSFGRRYVDRVKMEQYINSIIKI